MLCSSWEVCAASGSEEVRGDHTCAQPGCTAKSGQHICDRQRFGSAAAAVRESLLLGASHPFPRPSQLAPRADGPCASVLHFTQAVSPRGLPPLLGGAVRSFALGQVCIEGCI